MISGIDTGYKKLHTMNRRVFLLSIAKVVLLGGIITRLFSLQINENKKYLTLSDKNRLREWKLPPTRGEFLDYFGNVVAGAVAGIYLLLIVFSYFQISSNEEKLVQFDEVQMEFDKLNIQYSKLAKKRREMQKSLDLGKMINSDRKSVV